MCKFSCLILLFLWFLDTGIKKIVCNMSYNKKHELYIWMYFNHCAIKSCWKPQKNSASSFPYKCVQITWEVEFRGPDPFFLTWCCTLITQCGFISSIFYSRCYLFTNLHLKRTVQHQLHINICKSPIPSIWTKSINTLCEGFFCMSHSVCNPYL